MKGPVYFTYGRMNPPTTGHELLIEEMIKMGSHPQTGGPVYIFTSHSEDDHPKVRARKVIGKNPLPTRFKKNLIRKIVNKIKKNRPSPTILSTSKKNNIPQKTNNRIIGTGPLNVIRYLYNTEGFTDLRMIVGSNRGPGEKEGFNKILSRVPKDVSLMIIPVGNRRTNNGVSGSKSRKAVFKNDGGKEFRSCIASGISNADCEIIRKTIIAKKEPLKK